LDARRYYRAAGQRLLEADVILKKVGLPAASVYLAGYGVECMPKALLLERTPAPQRPALIGALKGHFGHSFVRLRAGLIARGVTVPRDVLTDLVLVSSWSPDLRYEPGPGDVRTAERFLRVADRVMSWADGRI
jgi:hypothetical protein